MLANAPSRMAARHRDQLSAPPARCVTGWREHFVGGEVPGRLHA